MSDKVMELVLKISDQEEELNQLDKTIESLSEEIVKKRDRKPFLEEENEDLTITHQLCNDDITNYKEQIKQLELNVKIESDIISNLKKENEELKKSKNIKDQIKEENINEEDEMKKKMTENISKLLGMGLIRKYVPSLSKEMSKEIQKQTIPKDILEKNINIKKEYESQFEKIKDKFNKYYEELDKEKELTKEYRLFEGKVKEQIQSIYQNFHISYEGVEINIKENDGKKKFDEISKKVDLFSGLLNELDKAFNNLENIIKVENILDAIQKNLDFINNEEYLSQNSLESCINRIKNLIDEIKNIEFLIEESKKDFDKKNDNIKKEMNELISLQKEYKKENIKRNNTIKKSLINNKNQNQKNNKNDIINKSLRKNNNPYLNKDNQSNILKPKDSKGKEELYKTINLFKENNEDEDENYIEEGNFLKKNWHEICYIYDDYDIHDIYYNIKAIELDNLASFSQYLLNIPSNSELEFVMVDGVNNEYEKVNDYMYSVELNLKNLEMSKIHYKYKHFKNKSYYELTYKKYYGISSEAGNTMGKYILINKGSYDIVKFDELFLVRNENNLDEVEYIWGGKVPFGGKETYITFTKKEARWLYNYKLKLFSSRNINEYLEIFVPVCFNEGNNSIIKADCNSPQTKNISFNDDNKEYVAEYRNIKSKIAEFNLKIEFINKSDEWFINITDEEVRKLMPKQDIKDKTKLQNIAKNIIKDFDNNHKNSKVEFLDFMKIGNWVHKNIKYDNKYFGREKYSALDIYNMKKGVCYHFTRLSNALLYSLGYKVIFAIGFVYHSEKKYFDQYNLHAWSLVKVGKKWYPFDSTKGIITGKLPITHIYRNYIYSEYSLSSYRNYGLEMSCNGKYIEK